MVSVSEVAEEPRHFDAQDGLGAGQGAPCAFSGCSGFFHPAGGPTGVVLCAPWGVEDLAMRKSWRLLAEAIAAAGYPCLRFDYPGTGNSLGHATEPSSIEEWIEAINSAAEFVRRVNGVRRFVYVGQTLGATLAVEAARRRSDVVGLHLVTPVVKARAYARELSVTGKRVADKRGIASELGPREGVNVMGFALSVPMFESLQALDLMKIDRLDIAHVTIYDQLDRTTSAEAVEHLRKLGADTIVEPAEPFRLMSAATGNQPLPVAPERIVARICAAHPIIFPAPTREPLLKNVLTGESFREEPIRFGRDESLFGILCGPLRPHDATPAVILLNRGLAPHIGWRRAAVDQARGLAAAGIASLRIDAAGLGESRDEPGRSPDLAYSHRLVSDIMAAVDVLAARGYTRITLAGVGSSAYMALTSAQADPRVTDVIAINAPRFVWNPKETIDDVVGLRSMRDHVGAFNSVSGLKTLIRNRDRIAPAMAVLAKRSLKTAMAHVPPRLRAMLLRDPMQARVEHLFATYTARGTHVSLVFSAGDPGLVELRTYFGPNGRNLRGTTTSVTILPDADHNLTTNAASAWMLEHMIEVAGERLAHGGGRQRMRHAYDTQQAICAT